MKDAETLPTMSAALKELFGKTRRLDCGHRVTLGHQFANTLIVHSHGYGKKLKTLCHECGY